MKRKKLLRILSFFISISVIMSAGLPAMAWETQYFVDEDFGDYSTNSIPEKIAVVAKKGYIAENEDKNDKYLVLEGSDQLLSCEYTFEADMENLFISFDLERTLGNKINDIVIKSGRGSFTAATISEKGEVMTYNGKVAGYTSSKKSTNIAFSFDEDNQRYSIYINGKMAIRDYWVGSNFPTGKILGFSVSTLINGDGSMRMDNVYCYNSSKLIDSKSHPKKEYNEEVLTIVVEEEEEEENTSIIKMSNFDGEDDIKTELGTAFQLYPNQNLIEKVYDERNDNKYVRMFKNTTSECFIQLYVSPRQKLSYQFDLKSSQLTPAYFMAISSQSEKATIMNIGNGGTITSGGVNIGKIDKRQWTNVTICIDNSKKMVSFYINGELAAENIAMPSGKLEDISMLRVGLGGNGESDMLIDNYIVYNSAKYVNYNSMLKGIIDEDLYIYNHKTKAVENVLGEFNAINTKSGFMSAGGVMEHLEEIPQTDGSDIMLNKSTAMKLVGVQPDDNTTEEVVSLTEFAKENGKTVTFTDMATIFVGDKTAELNKEKLLAVNAQLTYVRPEKDVFAGLIKNEHPRVMIDKQKLEQIKSSYGVNEYITEWGNTILAQADTDLKFPPLQYNKADGLRILETARSMSVRIMNFAMAYHLTGDAKYAERCWVELEAACNFQDWNQGVHSLDSTMMVFAVSIGYDWLYDYWSEERKSLMEQKSYELQMEPAYRTYHQAKTQDYGWATVANNWNAQCNGFIVTAACAMFEAYPDMYSDILKNALRCMEGMLGEFYPAGAWSEGPGYWAGTVQPLAVCYQTLDNTFGTSFNLELAPAFDITCEYLIGTTGTNGTNNYNDGGGAATGSPAMFWFTNRFGNEGLTAVRLNDMRNKNIEGTVYDMCYYNTEIGADNTEMPLDVYYKRIELVAMHSSYNEPTGTFLSYHSGNNLEGMYHSHLDSGTFVLDMLGERFVSDINGQNYNSDGMTTIYEQSKKGKINRWSYYQLTPEGHNCLLINPDETAGQNIVTDDKVEVLVSKPRGAYSITSLSSAYEGYAKDVRRGYMLGDDRRSVTIRDEIELNEGQNEVWWFMHTSNKTNFEFVDANTAVMELNGKKVKVKFITNADSYEMKEMEAIQLVREVPPQQDEILNFKKLGIKMSAKNSLYIQVKLISYDDPYADNELENILLDEWSIPDGELDRLPVGNGMTVDGKAYNEFIPLGTNYNLPVAFGAKQMPDVAINTDAGVTAEVIHKAQDVDDTTLIRVFDNNNPQSYRTYYITFETDMSTLNDYIIEPKSIEVSDVPQPENPAESAIDKNLSTRWSSEGDDKWLILDLGEIQTVEYVGIAFMSGNARKSKYKLYVSEDKSNWEMIFDGQSSGTTNDIELSQKISKNVRYIKFVGYGNTSNAWNSVTEIAAYKLK